MDDRQKAERFRSLLLAVALIGALLYAVSLLLPQVADHRSILFGLLVAAQIVVAPGQTLSAGALLTYARTQLAGYKLPRRLQQVDQLPLTASGKIHRDAVAAALAGAGDADFA